MKGIIIPTVSLLGVDIHRVALSENKKSQRPPIIPSPTPPFWNVDNILMENGGNLLLNNGSAIILESWL